MELGDKIHQHLPHYLNAEDRSELFNELKAFPDNIDHRIYSSHPNISDDIIYQGDVVNKQPVIFLPDITVKNKQVFIISNTCDIDLTNVRVKIPNVVYCPVISFVGYKKLVYEYYDTEQKAQDHLTSVRKQRITDMFYLPEHGEVIESIVLFDSVNNHRLSSDHLKNMLDNRIISLGNYGFMLFLVKLSIHFTRIEERVDRG